MNDSSPAVIKTLLKQVGMRATPARIATLAVLSQSSKPLSHAEVSAELKNLGVNKTTVYRNLNDLVGANLLRRAELGDHIWRFELANHQMKPVHPTRTSSVLIAVMSSASMRSIYRRRTSSWKTKT